MNPTFANERFHETTWGMHKCMLTKNGVLTTGEPKPTTQAPTTQAPTVAALQSVAAGPEFADHRMVTAMFSFSRAHTYRLWEAGLIKSVNLRIPGKLRGRRLFDVASIRALMFNNAD